MKLNRTQLHILHQPQDLSKKGSTGVSLHCHTEFSKEMLDFVPHYAAKLPIISFFWERERKNYEEREGKAVKFSTAYWSPPLNPTDVYNIEKKQINDAGLEAIVSVTDHDEIGANLKINENNENSHAPISLEWTVPFLYGFFHLGVHNLPSESAKKITDDLLQYTFAETEEPDPVRLHELFELLNSIPDVLVILNHPLWDIEMVGKERHAILLAKFIGEYGKWVHALEINGFRSWSENKAVLEIADALDFPVATGGDRHGCKPNTVLNLTNKNNFSEFVEEIRVSKRSDVVLMPEYMYPLHSRQLQSFSEILSFYPDFPEHRRRWFDRIFYDRDDGRGLVRLSDHGWDRGGPAWLRLAVKTLGLMGSPTMRPMFGLFRKRKDRVPVDLNKPIKESPEVREFISGFPGASAGSAG